jgi:hypothetical protein
MAAKRFSRIRVLAVWLTGFILAMVIILLWHELLMVFVVSTLGWEKYIVSLVHFLYYAVAGLLWMAFFLLQLEYLNRSARKGMLLAASMVTLGVQLLIIALGQAGLTLYGFFPADVFGLVLMAGEGLAGAGMLSLARYMRMRKKTASTAG